MKKRLIFLGLVLIVVVSFWFWRTRIMRVERSAGIHQSQNLPIRPIEASLGNSIASFKTNRTSVSVGKDYLEKRAADHQYDWKQPINFWGRVVDENGDSVAGASIHFIWNDISEDGTSEAGTTSDANGLFSLINQRGKAMTVNVSKEGYYTPQNERVSSFEYANPFDGLFTPDPNNPVVFHLRKRGETEPLIHWSKEITLVVGKAVSLPLDQGTTLQVTLLTNAPSSEKTWAALIGMVNGGIQPALDEFPFEAPTDGYAAELELNFESPKPPTWMSLYQGGQFYVKTATGYGRIELRTIAGKSFFQAEVYLNPSGSQNLEFDPSKEIKPNQ